MLSSVKRKELLCVALLLVGAFFIYWSAPVRQVTDARYALLLSESLIHRRSFTFDAYNLPRLAPRYHDNTFKNGEWYQRLIRAVRGGRQRLRLFRREP